MPKISMGKRIESLAIDSGSAVPLYRQLYAGVRDAILEGSLKPGTRILSTRSMAEDLGLSRTTVVLAFDQLLAEGYLESRVGDGTYVAAALSAKAKSPAPARGGKPPLSRRATTLLREGRRWVPQVNRPFALCGPAIGEFPIDSWRRLINQQMKLGGTRLLDYGSPAGYRPLRRVLAAHVATMRGVRCDPNQIVILPSSQQALDLAARVLLDPGEPVWVEDPGYPGAFGALSAAGAHIVPVPVDGDGISLEAGRKLQPRPRLIYVTPSHQFPLGQPMALERRLALLRLAKKLKAWIVEDDYDSEYRYGGRPLQALQGLDDAGRVIYVGTFSKIMFPSLRLAYVVLPPELVEGFLVHRMSLDHHSPLPVQAALAAFIEEGRLAAHLRNTRSLYAERLEVLRRSIAERLGSDLRIEAADTGLHLTAWLTRKKDDVGLAQRIIQRGVQVRPLSCFYRTRKKGRGLVLGYAGFTSAEIRSGVRRMAAAFRARCC